MTRRRHQVVLTSNALADACAIVEYVARENPMNAERLYARLFSRIDLLSSLPERGRRVPELRGHGVSDLREIVVRPYRVIYRVASTTVYVLAVLDGRRDLDDLLLERLIRVTKPEL